MDKARSGLPLGNELIRSAINLAFCQILLREPQQEVNELMDLRRPYSTGLGGNNERLRFFFFAWGIRMT